jgi:hypothetical protein
MSYQTIVQWEILHKNHDFATHIPNLFFKAIKILIHCVRSSSWIPICKAKLLGCQLKVHEVINKLNLNVLLVHSNLGYMDLSRIRTSPDYLS